MEESYYEFELDEPVGKSSRKSKKSRSGSRTRSRSNSRTVKVGNGAKMNARKSYSQLVQEVDRLRIEEDHEASIAGSRNQL